MRLLMSVLALALVAACGGTTQPNRTSVPGSTVAPTASTTTTVAPASMSGELPSGAELCALLTSTDWGQFNYVTAAQPDISSDGPGSAHSATVSERGVMVSADESMVSVSVSPRAMAMMRARW